VGTSILKYFRVSSGASRSQGLVLLYFPSQKNDCSNAKTTKVAVSKEKFAYNKYITLSNLFLEKERKGGRELISG
jgi:hypothetical protein